MEPEDTAAASEEEKKDSDLSTADVMASAIGFYLDSIIQEAAQNDENKNVNVVKLGTRIPGSTDVLPFDNPDVAQILPAFANLLTKKDNGTPCNLDILNKLSKNALFLNQIVPYVRLYKIFTTTDGVSHEVEIPFDIVAGQKTGDRQTFEEKVLNGGSGGAVGISDFKWVSEGKNEGNNSIYTVSFKVVLQDISELERIRNRKLIAGGYEQEEISTEDGEIQAQSLAEEQIQVSILDLLYPAFKKEGELIKFEGQDPSLFIPEKMFIKADVGWNMPAEYAQFSDYFKTSLYLHLYKHNFSFNENGMVEIEITYIGNLETQFSDKTKYNILQDSRVTEIENDLEILSTLEYETNIYNGYNSNYVPIRDTETISYQGTPVIVIKGVSPGTQQLQASFRAGPNRLRPPTKLDVTTLTEQLRTIIRQIKIGIFYKMLRNLLDNNKVRTLGLDEKEYQILKEILQTKNITPERLVQINKKVEKLNGSKTNNIGVTKPDSNLDGAISTSYLKKDYKSIDAKKLNELLVKNQYRFIIDTNLGGLAGTNGRYVSYVFLGDLLQAIIDTTEIDKNKMRVYLSPFTYKNYSDLSQVEPNNQYVLRKVTKKGEVPKAEGTFNIPRKSHSMAYIPISIDALINWYNNDILKTEETAYTFNRFLKKIFTDFIPSTIGLGNTPFSPKQKVLTQPIYFNTKNKPDVQNTTLDTLNFSRFYNGRTQPYNGDELYNNIAFISTAEDNMEKFNGDYEIDCQNNVYHIPINSMKSIVKKINFKRDDNQKLETANLLSANDASQNKIIRQVYHCNIDMFGNTFFEPGQLIYIKPTYPGTNFNMNVLFSIGLGGYYRILKISNNITPGGFTTSLECRWEMFGDKYSKDSVNVLTREQLPENTRITLKEAGK